MMSLDQMRHSLRLFKQSAFFCTTSRFCNNAALSVTSRCIKNSFHWKKGPRLLSYKNIVGSKNHDPMSTCYCLFSNEVSTPERKTSDSQELRNRLRKLLDEGVIQVPKPREITSLPDKLHVTGREESFIGLDLNSYLSGSSSFPFFIAASSEKEIFLRYCIPREAPSENFLKWYSVEYDQENQKYTKNGECLETVEPKQAFSELLEYFKRHEKPVLTTFRSKSCPVLKLYMYTKDNGLYTDMLETVPCFIDVHRLAKDCIPAKILKNYSLSSLCQFGLNFDISNSDATHRAVGIRRLFQEYLLPKGFASFVTSLDFYYARNSYAQMVVDDKILDLTGNKLAKQGICLDHLQYLKTKGEEEFKNYLTQRYISLPDSKHLYTII